MILSDRSIHEELAQGRIIIDPMGENAIQPASVDIRLDREILIFRNNQRTHIDVTQPADDVVERVIIEDGVPFMLHPGQFALGSTLETVTIPDDIVARIEGKSSLARYGLLIHSTAGFVDPGWSGQLTLEFSNVGILGITLYYGMKIGHISFNTLSTPADNPYGSKNLRSKYQGQGGPATSRYYMDYQLPLNGSDREK
ncbi:MAG: dCTP deaminase [Dehalococcoidia bacterium]|nr:MAG: dCTP deaminase [Dehalococcoidia bacterium]